MMFKPLPVRRSHVNPSPAPTDCHDNDALTMPTPPQTVRLAHIHHHRTDTSLRAPTLTGNDQAVARHEYTSSWTGGTWTTVTATQRVPLSPQSGNQLDCCPRDSGTDHPVEVSPGSSRQDARHIPAHPGGGYLRASLRPASVRWRSRPRRSLRFALRPPPTHGHRFNWLLNRRAPH